ncbi:AraC family transcriptional regulator [Mycobacterium hodleri]|uniref:AraC family transcriptional regulator n=1 Tax=Mycolicibacterium hodleri TaxID=49897 RepID=A0A544W6P8_9MYCO|nr:AraC family transcriptional regulator [Mycolicibacterium hodleri]TQR87923.1 AraC family transcriptional regulator [Mycolicibacterium hodleri]
MLPFLLLQREEVHSNDPVEIRSYLNRVYRTDVTVQPLAHRSGARFMLEHNRIGHTSFALERIRQSGDVEVRADDPTGCLVVLWALDGRAESFLHGQSGVAAPGQPIIGATGAAPVRVRASDATLDSVVLHGSLLAKAAADLGPERPADVTFTGVEPVSAEAGRALTAARRYVEESVLADDGFAAPLVLAAAGRLLAATVLAAFPNTTGNLADVDERGSDAAHPALLRRAMDYIEEHAADDVGIGDVAGAVYVTPRALQYMFRRHLDSTPMAYLRRVRLDHVHRDLVTADRGTTTVTATAARWGFAHTGRFAVLYRATYGQSPHVTLRS